jgi:hypothetical protein
MNSIFVTSFAFVMFIACLKDWPRLQQGKTSGIILYGLIGISSLVLLICRQFHINVPLPAAFFTNIISPWLIRIIGI